MNQVDATRRQLLKLGATAAPVLAVAGTANRAEAAAKDDLGVLNALLSAEWDAVKAYEAGAAYLQSPSDSDAAKGLAPTVLAVAQSFLNDHQAHASKLASVITTLGGTPVAKADVAVSGLGASEFSASVLNIIKLAANKEKAAAVAYTNVQKTITDQSNAALAAAIGATESQHFIVLFALQAGLVEATSSAVPTDIVPKSFVLSAIGGGDSGLDKVSDLAFA